MYINNCIKLTLYKMYINIVETSLESNDWGDMYKKLIAQRSEQKVEAVAI